MIIFGVGDDALPIYIEYLGLSCCAKAEHPVTTGPRDRTQARDLPVGGYRIVRLRG
jgi:hypothetical protein